MKVKVNKSLMEEFARVYNAWNEKHDLEPVQDIQTLANMALAKAIVAMREGNDECKEWSEQWTGCCEDDYYGHYYWETEYPGKYLHMEFWF